MNTDVLIIGSGLAGMASALYISEMNPSLQIIMMSKAKADESNTLYAQGGIASVIRNVEDSFEQHIEDTMKAGHYRSNRTIVELVVKAAPDCIKDLERWSVEFDRRKEGTYELGLEGGHSANRILHHKDTTGREIYRKLNQKVTETPNIQLINNCAGIRLTEDTQNQIRGAQFLKIGQQQSFTISAQKTILASGGIGQLFGYTTNPKVATADGLAMAIRAGAALRNMHFVQFHPTLFYKKTKKKSFLISEAVRGYGAILLNKNGQRFMPKYDENAELATRDIVCEAIAQELLLTKHPFVYLDCRHLEPEDFKNKFPFIINKCEKEGIDIRKDLIPVVPAAHYHCGGVAVNALGQSSVKNLYAVGEVAETGLHGKNRLASNSLLEAVVFAKRIGTQIAKEITPMSTKDRGNIVYKPNTMEKFDESRLTHHLHDLQLCMQNFTSITSDQEYLHDTLEMISSIQQNMDFDHRNMQSHLQVAELHNMLLVAEKIVSSAIAHLQKVDIKIK